MEKTKKPNSFANFLKQNLALVIIIACAIAVCAIVMIINGNKTVPTDVKGGTDTGIYDPIIPNQPQTKKYIAPVAGYTIGMDYSRDSEFVLVFKKTLNEYSVHNGIDFIAQAGAEVVAVNDGTVTAVNNNFGMGYCVEITHEDGTISRYCSLGEEVCVVLGQDVEAGDKIGTVSTTASDELLEGDHLHFEMLRDGEFINPHSIIEEL